MHVKVNYTFLYLRGITARHQDELFSRSNQELRAIGLDVTPHLSDCTPPSISVIEHSADELKLLDYLISQRAMIRDFACQLPLPVGQLVISKTRALVFDTHDESCGYVLKSHLGAYVNDAME